MNSKKKIVIILCLVFGFAYFGITTLARYSSSSAWNYYLESRGFYFSSDYLGNNSNNVNTLWDGDSVHFNLKNSSNENLVTDFDIRYRVTCEVIENPNVNCKINGTNDSTVTGVLSSNSRCVNEIDEVDVSSYSKSECEIRGYSWENIAVSSDLYFDLVPVGNYVISNVNVKITANTTEPYNKTIEGVFSLYKNSYASGSVSKQVIDGVDSDSLILTNSYDSRKCVTVEFDSSKRIVNKEDDMSNFVLDQSGYIEEFKIGINAFSNRKIIFYNRDFSYNYSVDDFIVTEVAC